ncbi:MAG: transcription-repair coupling factor [Phycisphaerales bacterium]|nr:transcription-repair coupling factor [Planctomycetota bacterium]MBL6997657.1 transcription-repair coupling factor [Phycisphaerales bacterium]
MSGKHVYSAIEEVSSLMDVQGCVTVGPVSGSFGAMAVSELCKKRSVLFVTAHLDDADESVVMLRDLGIQVEVFPALEVEIAKDILATRYALLDSLQRSHAPNVIVASVPALMQKTPSPLEVKSVVRRIQFGDSCSLSELQQWLVDAGYERRETVDEASQFALRGGILDIATAAGEFVRLDFFGDTIEAINEIDPVSLGSDCVIDEVILTTSIPTENESNLVQHIPNSWCVVLDDAGEISQQARSYFDRVTDSSKLAHLDDVQAEMVRRLSGVIGCSGPPAVGVEIQLPVRSLPIFSTVASEALAELVEMSKVRSVLLTCRTSGEAERMKELMTTGQELESAQQLHVVETFVHRGFLLGDDFAIVPTHEIFHRYELRRGVRSKQKTMRQAMASFDVDDIVVHRDHGIAQYLGIRHLDGQEEIEYLTLKFAGGKLLHVPGTHAHLVQRYVGAFKGRPELSTLGGTRWANQKVKAKGAVVDLAHEMIRVQAIRESAPGIAFPEDTQWMQEFESSFPWEETEDQNVAIAAVKTDMQSSRPMDRLICGDVGFGKTEIAIRAAFKAAESGRQVAILVPTTVLAVQHERTIQKRLADYPFVVESLTRFHTPAEQKEILERVSRGEVDILIGTHRILSKDVFFSRLGLVVIDEEQRFGVEHKQRLLALRAEADVLTLTATPIPRTLHMALLGIRDISSLQIAPVDRRAVVTEIKSWDTQLVKDGILRELAREGQVFYVHNRVFDIEEVAEEIRNLVPEARVIVGHGQMPPRALEKVMLDFVQGNADVLVSTTIIESGIDIPSANTMFIDDADRFGLSDLHQLRGRVGRYKHRAYCTLLLPRDRFVNTTARKRLHAIEQFSMLGAGFQIALRDLEIRGAGNLLGAEQSGHIAAVGYEMYCQLLEQAVQRLKDGKKTSLLETMIDLGETGTIPTVCIAAPSRRLSMYCRLAQCESQREVDVVVHDLKTGYGDLPDGLLRLVRYHELRVAAALLNIASMTLDEEDVVIRTKDVDSLRNRLKMAGGTLRQVGNGSSTGFVALYYRSANQDESMSILSELHHHLVESSCVS